jgi:hypothetical protein
MGNQVNLVEPCRVLAAGLLVFASPAQAQAEGDDQSLELRPSAGVEFFASADSDDTSVVKLLGRTLLADRGPDTFAGLSLERAWFTPLGQETRKDTRAYLEVANPLGRDWLGRIKVGTDGKTWLGSANLRTKDWSKEIFLEREIVETPRGVDEGIYYTFLGGSMDFPLSDRDTFNATAAVQGFTGRNERLHLRGSYVHVVKSKLGLSVQLRARIFHSTEPGEFDYYSPRNFLQALPVVQMRRFTATGWMVLGAVGYGLQRATNSEWQSARLAEIRLESPRNSRDLRAFLNVQYSNNSLNGSGDYHYVMGRVGLTAKF